MRTLGAVILTGSIEVNTAPATAIEPLLRVPAVRRIIPSMRAVLDLDDNPFRYLACRNGTIRPMRGVAVPFCRCGASRRRSAG